MIDYFNIPTGALIDAPITKKLFTEKGSMSAAEKRLLREEVERITMKGLLQTRTVGLAEYVDDEYAYDQVVVGEVSIKNRTKAPAVAAMIQKAFPVPMFLIVYCEGNYCVNWCVKRINQADKTRRVLEEQQFTRFFALENNDSIVNAWLQSLNISRLDCGTLKDLFDELANRMLMLAVSDEAGIYIEKDNRKTEQYRSVLAQLAVNRAEQKRIMADIKAETQFNRRLTQATALKTLQQQEKELKNKLI